MTGRRPLTARRVRLPVVLLVGLAGCSASRSTLRSSGPAARQTARLAVGMFIVAGVVVLAVVVLIVVAAVRGRRPGPAEPDRSAPSSRVPLWAGAVLPAIVLAAVLFVSFGALRAQASRKADLTVEVVGHRWWWEVRYPDGTAEGNELHVPAGERVHVRLTSADVIHSLWIPSLAGKRDAFPGRWTDLYLQADHPGQWAGPCAEYCGVQHSNMTMTVVAQRPSDFRTWQQAEGRAAPAPADAATLQGQQVFLGAACSYCHRVRGTDAQATIGPDLTHVASRSTLAGGALTNTEANLAGWILDPQRFKPGTLMPPTNLSGPELQALLHYLESLG